MQGKSAGRAGLVRHGVSRDVNRPLASGRTAVLALLTLVPAVSLALRCRAFGRARDRDRGARGRVLRHVAADSRWGLVIIVAGVVGYFVGTPVLRRTTRVSPYVLLVWLAGLPISCRGPAGHPWLSLHGSRPAEASCGGPRSQRNDPATMPGYRHAYSHSAPNLAVTRLSEDL